MKKIFAVVLFSMCMSGPAYAEQESAAHAAAEMPTAPMQPFAWLIGEWRGTGWLIARDGVRSEFESVETVTPRLSGAAILVEGRHHLPGKPAELVHDAMAMLVWDVAKEEYRFRTVLADGRNGDYRITPLENGFVWTMEVPQGEVRYNITYADGIWKEEGVMAMANGRAVKFFEMELSRVEQQQVSPQTAR